ncbi:MAG: abortive infection family protein [Alphaproteobacteria bacterium]|nr:abortive infection family protein [Alphaproteobacteria bacterium]
MMKPARPPDLPENPLERAELLQNMLIAHATDGAADDATYKFLRSDFMSAEATARLLPKFVRTCRDLSQFWGFIKYEKPTYRERREMIYAAFRPLLDDLEGANRAPADNPISDVLASFDSEGVHAAWGKALQRRQADPEGAITMARTLLETVCKRILDGLGDAYEEGAELPQLYSTVSRKLNLAPSRHTEESFKVILGSCQQIVERLGTLRNKIGDAHGKGGKPVKPSARHAHLAVNLAGTMATFLVETWQARTKT